MESVQTEKGSRLEVKLSGQGTLLPDEPIIEDIADKSIEQHKLVKTMKAKE
jgi:hypothetical protein